MSAGSVLLDGVCVVYKTEKYIKGRMWRAWKNETVEKNIFIYISMWKEDEVKDVLANKPAQFCSMFASLLLLLKSKEIGKVNVLLENRNWTSIFSIVSTSIFLNHNIFIHFFMCFIMCLMEIYSYWASCVKPVTDKEWPLGIACDEFVTVVPFSVKWTGFI